MDGQKGIGSFNIAPRGLISDKNKEQIISIRREQSSNNKQPAQDRLKRLQTKLKQVNCKKPDKERIVPRKPTRNSANSPNSKGISINQQFQARTSVPSVQTPVAQSIQLSEKLKSWSYTGKSRSGQSNVANESSTSGFNKRRSIPNPITIRIGSRNAWAKPNALLDASNRLAINRSMSANQRLTLLRQSLQQNHKDCRQIANNNNNNNNNNELPSFSKKLPAATAPKVIITEKTIQLSKNNPPTDDIEPMDIDYEQEEERSSNSNVLAFNESTSTSTEEETLDRPLLEWIFPEQELPKRLEDHMYFVLDTNVLMNNLAFVEDLSRVALGGTNGSMLYIPYIVIKELDKLKDRRSEDSHKRCAAIRAIHYLNNKFDDSLKIQAQSALEEAEHLIEVDSADDSIVNCCLQLMAQVPNLMLLTNDANLRLKANATSILVSCRSDLLNDYRVEFDALSS